MIRRPPRSTLFPYTRSSDLHGRFQSPGRHTHRPPRHRGKSRDTGGRRTFLRTLPPTPRPPDNSFPRPLDRKSTRLNSSHLVISYAAFCLTKKIKPTNVAARP